MVGSRYSWTWRVSIIWWSPGIICTIVVTGQYPGRGDVRWVSPYINQKPWWVWWKQKVNFMTEQPYQGMKTEQLCREWWRRKVSFVYAHVSMLHTHTFEGLQSWVTKPTNTQFIPITRENLEVFLYFCAKPYHRTTTSTAKPTPRTFHETAFQQELPTIFSLHLFNPCAY